MHKHSRDTRTPHSTRAQMSTHKNAGKKLTRKFVLLYVARSVSTIFPKKGKLCVAAHEKREQGIHKI